VRTTRTRLPILEPVLLVAGIVFVSPVLIALLNSFKPLHEITANPLALPQDPTLAAYRDVFARVRLAQPMMNSLLMVLATIASLVTIAPMAAYSLTRRRMRTAPFLRIFFLAGLMIPFQVIMIPLLKEFRLLGIPFTYLSLLITYVATGLPLAIFIYTGFLSTVPKGLEEAASIDGCGQFATFWRIIFPLLSPCTVTIIIFWGLWIWNDFLIAFIVMGTSRGILAFVQLWQFLSDKYVKNWDTIFAGVVILSIPLTILYLAMQRRLVKGLTAGAIK